ncbi:MAG: DinB family protein [Bacteroidales bacterium]
MARTTGSDQDTSLREYVVKLLDGGQAHAGFEAAIKGIPPDLRNRAPKGLPYSPWQLLEHLRIAQWDIVEFSRSAQHQSPSWPDGYWPSGKGTEAAWRKSVRDFRNDLQAMRDMVLDPGSDLFTPFPWGDGQTLLREALLVADHNAYHIGELIAVRRLLGAWK